MMPRSTEPLGDLIAAVPQGENSPNRARHRPIAIDLFSGVGGLSLGFEQAGFDVVAAVEYDPVHAAVHEFNFPRTAMVCADVSHLPPRRLLEAARAGFVAHGNSEADWTGEIDVIFGGPPCQGFSAMGKRDVYDTRNRLVFDFVALIESLHPRYFVMENVPGMASGAQANVLAALFERLKKAGYGISVSYDEIRRSAILSVADFGVPQDRRRLILMGARNPERIPHYPAPTVWAVPKRTRGSKKGSKSFDLLPTGPTVWDAIGGVPDLDGFELLSTTDEVRLTSPDLERMENNSSGYAQRLRGVVVDPEDLSYSRVWDPYVLTSSLRTHHTSESIQRFSATAQGETEPISRFYRLDSAGLCNTLRAGTGSERGAFTSPRPIHPRLPRVISVREAARLHSFPDWFRFHRTKSNGFRSIGNSVPPLFGRALARAICDAAGIKSWKPREMVRLGKTDLLSLSRLEAAEYYGADVQNIPASRLRR